MYFMKSLSLTRLSLWKLFYVEQKLSIGHFDHFGSSSVNT